MALISERAIYKEKIQLPNYIKRAGLFKQIHNYIDICNTLKINIQYNVCIL